MPRRKPGALLPFEIEILVAALEARQSGDSTFHGFGLAHSMRRDGGGGLIGHGTLYKALGRLEEMGLLSSRWEEDPPHGRPRRRLYELTPAGLTAAQAAVRPASRPTARRGFAAGTA